jgi:ketosteroid isomerase-like protein
VFEGVRLHKPDLKLKPLSVVLDNHNVGKNVNFPEIIPDLDVLKGYIMDKPPKLEPKKKVSLDFNGFGFDCSAVKKGESHTECFNQFSNFSNKKLNNVKASKAMVKQPLAPQRKAQNVKASKAKVKQPLAPQRKAQPDNLVISNTSFGSSPKNVPPVASLYLKKWVKAWETQDVDKYLSFYSKNFKGKNNTHEAWKASRERALVGKNKGISINLHSVQAQKTKNLIEINFIQNYSSSKHSDTGLKELVLEKNNDDWKIVKETWVQGKKITKKSLSIKPTKFINGELSGWLKAWAKQDVNSYLSFYSDQFKNSKHDLAKWQASRKIALSYWFLGILCGV